MLIAVRLDMCHLNSYSDPDSVLMLLIEMSWMAVLRYGDAR